MFGKRNFPGFTWDEQIVATNTEYDFDQFGWEDSNFIIDPVHWFMAARIGPHANPKKNIWRISYGELPGLTDQELMERQEMKFEQMLPGNPKPSEYRVVNKSPYKVHQRCCESMRINRVLLAADAAHLCNPFGKRNDKQRSVPTHMAAMWSAAQPKVFSTYLRPMLTRLSIFLQVAWD